eukprot:TRINITY_DN31823_c0_g1_i2.p1 TRINITY_DN31823_c0_g1~~TRINITY_DN31823_c0_g1_i2.p1  ORF type:complete len:144 (-),score=21.24 TRINITY_DN31823_c0_g1_i2:48-479(-)
MVVDEQTIKKPKAQWSDAEKTKSNCTIKAINGIYNGITLAEFHRISACLNAKAAWHLLQTDHEGVNTVKQTKLQNLTTAFETIMMKESETSNEFNTKLSKIVNSSFNLEEPVPRPRIRIVKKILRTLPKRFVQKCLSLRSIKT